MVDADVWGRVIDWKLSSPWKLSRPKSTEEKGSLHMIRQFTIELRVNYADEDKNETMRAAIAHAARHVVATASLIADGVKPEIAIWSDDWFAGKKEIELLSDVIQQGLDEAPGDNPGEVQISSELMTAVRDSA